MPDDKIKSIAQYLAEIGKIQYYKNNHSYKRVWFRGQNNSNWGLIPGVFRPNFYPVDCNEATRETKRLNKERHLTQDFMIYSSRIRSNNLDRPELYFMQQHYGAATRLLDWSTNALVGLFFSVYDEMNNQKDSDSAVYMLDAYQFGRRGMNTSKSRELKIELSYIYDWKDSLLTQLSKDILIIRPSQSFGRMTAQSGHFTLCNEHNREVTANNNHSIRKFVISKNNKEEILNELSRLDINEFTVYQDLDNLSKWLKRRN